MTPPDPQHNPHRRTSHLEADRPPQRGSFLHPAATDGTPCWVPLGPSVVHEGGAHGTPPVSGRVVDVAMVPATSGGEPRVYVATSNGGVWRSLDGGRRWSPRMEGLDLDPQGLGRHTLGCGALEVVAGATPEEDRLFLGTGEANSRDRYFGIGFLASDTGGNAPGEKISWREEEADPPLDGFSCYTLVRDPDDPEHLLAATTRGLYRRRPDKTWHRVLEDPGDSFTDVVAAALPGGGWRFLAVAWGGRVYVSGDGLIWDLLTPKTRRPFAEDRQHDRPGRVGLAAGPGGVVYALVHNTLDDGILGVWRLDPWDAAADPAEWQRVFFHPEDLFGAQRPRQGDFDLALTVHPQDANVLYLGGSALTIVPSYEYGAALYRCQVKMENGHWVMQHRMIGATVHPDVHALLPDPSHANGLWVGCDGGLFTCRDTTVDDPTFRPANTGLATLLTHHLAQHAELGDVLLVGSQDNSCLLYTGSPAWHHMTPGDCGHVVLHPETFYRALRTVNGSTVRGARFATTREAFSGAHHAHPSSALQFAGFDASPDRSRFWTESEGSWTRFYPPLIGAPSGETVAFGSCRPWISDDFGLSWYPLSEGQFELDHLGTSISALLLVSPDQLYAGTEEGKIFRYRREANNSQTWRRESLSRSDGAWALPQGFTVTDFAPGPDADTVFVTFGGSEAPVWCHDAQGWHDIAGPQDDPNGLPRSVHYGAIAHHPDNQHLFVGSDIGVWRSEDGGATWASFCHRLPDAPVFDLLLSPDGNRLRASTYGRGVFEVRLDGPLKGPHLELLSIPEERDLLHPEPSLRLDRAEAKGSFAIADPSADFQTLEAALATDSPRLVALDELTSRNLLRRDDDTLAGRAYVEVFNRGPKPAGQVQVRTLLAEWDPSQDDPPTLPSEVVGKNLKDVVMDGDPLPAPWQALKGIAGGTTVEVPVSVDALNPGFATFELGTVPTGTQWILVAFAWCPQDPLQDFGSTAMDPRLLGRQATWRRIKLQTP